MHSPVANEARSSPACDPSDRSTVGVARRDILGIPFDLISYENALGTVERWRQEGERRYITFTPPHSVILSRRDPRLMAATMQAGLVLPDGVGIAVAARILNYPSDGRVTGPLFMLKACDWGRQYGYRHYFYGGAEGVAEALVDRLRRVLPGLEVAGLCCPPFRSLSCEEDQRLVEAINASKPDLVWVGLGSPKQERWMHEHAGTIDATALVGVGAAFDFHSGHTKWAPGIIRTLGFEWAYRLAREPRRMGPRFLTSCQFLLEVLGQRLTT